MTAFQVYQRQQSGRWAYVWDGFRTLEEARDAIKRCATPGETSTFKITRLYSTEEDVETVAVWHNADGEPISFHGMIEGVTLE